MAGKVNGKLSNIFKIPFVFHYLYCFQRAKIKIGINIRHTIRMPRQFQNEIQMPAKMPYQTM